ncbi:MAG: dTDP-4-dehydrorhamnose reductase [Pseudomonadota bacterium]
MSSKNSQRILVCGARGQIGSALSALLPGSIAVNSGEADFCHPDRVLRMIEELSPNAVFNAAAYTQVEKAEDEEEKATLINAVTPGKIAEWCAKSGATFVHFSTDYVFSGEGDRPRTEDDPAGPVNAYGRSKAKGDELIAAAGGRSLIFRTSWLYDWRGDNFLRKMIRLGGELEVVRVVDDQFGSPTFAPDLAKAVVAVHEQAMRSDRFPSGVYNLCNSGETTWFGFAKAIFDAAAKRGIPLKVHRVESLSTKEYGERVKRPKNSRLNTEKAKRVFGVSLPTWEEGLASCMERLP